MRAPRPWLAALLAKEGQRRALSLLLLPKTPRTVALMQPSIQLLRYLGIWPGVLKDQRPPCASPPDDDTGALSRPPISNLIHRNELEAFGWNIPLGNFCRTPQTRAEDLGVIFIEATAAEAEVSEAQYMSACQMAPKFPYLSASLPMARIQPCENLQALPPIVGPMTRQLSLQASPTRSVTTMFQPNTTDPLVPSQQFHFRKAAQALSGWIARRAPKHSWL